MAIEMTVGMATITMRQLGQRGRFGNTLLQHAFIRAYAVEHGAEYQMPPTVLKHLFGLDDNLSTEDLPPYQEQYENGDCHRPLPPISDELLNHDFQGWAQHKTEWWTPERRKFWRDYRPTEAWLERLRPITEANRYDAGTVIGIQIRRGDYGQGSVYDSLTPVAWYIQWLKDHWWKFAFVPKLFIATEDRELVEPFAAYNPVTVESLGVELRAEPYPLYNYLPEDLASGKAHLLDWFPEWYALTQCDILLAANSTFSLTAAMVRSSAGKPVEFWRPSWEAQGFVREELWNCRPLRLDCPR